MAVQVLDRQVDGQVAGYVTVFDVPKGSFTFVTVHGVARLVLGVDFLP